MPRGGKNLNGGTVFIAGPLHTACKERQHREGAHNFFKKVFMFLPNIYFKAYSTDGLILKKRGQFGRVSWGNDG